jgi:hypothetical protein
VQAQQVAQQLHLTANEAVAPAAPLLRLRGAVQQALEAPALAAAAQQQGAGSAARPADYSVQWLDLRIAPQQLGQPNTAQ